MLGKALSGETFSFEGSHYSINEYTGSPRPVQSPRPPILIGAGGKRMLSIAARVGDIVGINGTLTAGVVGPEAIATMTAAAVDEKVAILHTVAGGRLADIELNMRVFMVRVTDDRQAVMEQIAGFLQVEASLVEESPFALIGTPSQLIDDLLRRRERWGISYVTVGADDVESFAPVVAELAGRYARWVERETCWPDRGRARRAVRPSPCTCRSSAACPTFDAGRQLGLVRRP